MTGREELQSQVAALEAEMAPLRERLRELEAHVDAIRAELRRAERGDLARTRAEVRERLRVGETPSLEELMALDDPTDDTAFDDLEFVRESATVVRLGYAAASRQAVSLTDGSGSVEAVDLGSARRAWRDGWEFGTVAARGVRVYPVGSRAEKLVAATEVRLRPSS